MSKFSVMSGSKLKKNYKFQIAIDAETRYYCVVNIETGDISFMLGLRQAATFAKACNNDIRSWEILGKHSFRDYEILK